MRIVAGRHRGRVLMTPGGQNTRPTSDRAREALFNIIDHGEPRLVGERVLDAFAGSGALGFEALSRGAGHATFLENDGQAFAVIYANAKKLEVDGQVSVLRADAANPPKAPAPCRFVFIDPPYKSGLARPTLTALQDQGWIAPFALVVVEVAAGEPFVSPIEVLTIVDERTYGAARLVFLRSGEKA